MSKFDNLIHGRKYLVKYDWMPSPVWARYDKVNAKFWFLEKERSSSCCFDVAEIIADHVGSEEEEDVKVKPTAEKSDKISIYRDIMHNFERKDRDEWVSLKDKLEQKREKLCEEWGGHFYGEPQDDTVKMAIGWKKEVSRICMVCRKKDYLKVDYEE